ncbi:MAG: FAD-dependent oxidoreductase, partial [Solirubrobacterales bacterium]
MGPLLNRRGLLQAAAGTALASSGLLAACGGSSGLPAVTGSLITRWRADPFALGSYSYLAAGARPGERQALAAPASERLFFAGEATSSGFPATTQGALLSGRRAAEEVLKGGGGSVIVIGSGLAGLGAAGDLVPAGSDVRVIEARGRIGGRTWTEDALAAPADMGASWIHGIRRNPIASIAGDLGLELGPTNYENGVVYTATGGSVALDGVPEATSLATPDARRASLTD